MALALLACLLVLYLVHEVTFSISEIFLFVVVAALFGLSPYWSLRRRLERFLKRALMIATCQNVVR